jgi:hypothetical protein
LSFGFPQQVCSQHHLLRSQKALALILAFIFAGGFFFAGSREARAAGHDDQQSPQAPQAAQQQESAPASPQSVPVAAPITVQPASVEPPPVAPQAPVSQAPVVTQSAPLPQVSSAPVAADPAPAGSPANIGSPATTVQTPPSTPLSIPVGSGLAVSSAPPPPPVLTTDSSKPVAQNQGSPESAGAAVQAPRAESVPNGSTSGSPGYYTPQASASPTPQPVTKTSRQPGPAPQTPPQGPVSAGNPRPTTSLTANQLAQLPRLIATSNQPVVSMLGISGRADKEISLLLTRLGRDAVAKTTIKPLRNVAPSFLLSHVGTKKGTTAAWVSATPDTSDSIPSPSALLGNVEDSAAPLLQDVANVEDSVVALLQGVANSVLDAPTNMAPLQVAAGSYKETVGTPFAGVPFSKGAQITALPWSSPITVESASHDPPEPSSPLSLPEESNVPFSLSSSQLSSGGGGSAPLLLLLAGALASVLFLLGRDGRLLRVSLQLPKPSSALIPVLERPG